MVYYPPSSAQAQAEVWPVKHVGKGLGSQNPASRWGFGPFSGVGTSNLSVLILLCVV